MECWWLVIGSELWSREDSESSGPSSSRRGHKGRVWMYEEGIFSYWCAYLHWNVILHGVPPPVMGQMFHRKMWQLNVPHWSNAFGVPELSSVIRKEWAWIQTCHSLPEREDVLSLVRGLNDPTIVKGQRRAFISRRKKFKVPAPCQSTIWAKLLTISIRQHITTLISVELTVV